MIKNIVFDMGKVLVEYEGDRVCRHFSEDEALIRKVSTAVFVSPEWLMLDMGIISEEEGLSQILARLEMCIRDRYLAVTPWGDLYPCHQFVGNEEFLLGNVDTGIVNEEIRNEFKLCNVYAKESCKDCFARFYCSGGCSANSYNFSGSINGAYEIGCEMQKKRCV